MNISKKWFFVFVIIIIFSQFAAADDMWEGTAAMSRFGEFPVTGYYGASNSFPVNTVISVENLRNNKSIDVIIANPLSDNNLFLLLSKDAAEKLDIKQDEVMPVRTKIVKEVITPDLASTTEEKALSSDPDNNPVKTSAPVAAVAPAAGISDALTETPLSPAEELAAADGVSVIESADPGERIYVIYDDTEDTPEYPEALTEAAPIAAEETPVTDALEEVPLVAEEPFSESAPVAEAIPPVIAEIPTEAETPKLVEYVDENGEKMYVLLPSDPKPPVVETEKLIPAKITGSQYFLQLMAFKDYQSAEKGMKTVKIDYPMTIYHDEKQNLYKVLVGPLNNDERGAALYNARITGIRDAFLNKKSE